MPAGPLAATVSVLFVLAALPAQDAPAPPPIPWRTDFRAARAEASEQHKPLFVVFRCER